MFGHDEPERIFLAAASNRLHHAWLLDGPTGVGRTTLAIRFARALLAGFPGEMLDVETSHPVFGQIAAGSHPDLKFLSCGLAKVEDMREMLETLAWTTASGGWRVVIIDDAESLNRHAVNAVLKVLEEPQPRSLFILTAAGRLLPATLRSRCVRVELRPVCFDDTAAAIRSTFPDIENQILADLLRQAGGFPGRAIRLHARRLDDAAPGERDDVAHRYNQLHEATVNLARSAGGRLRRSGIEQSCRAWSEMLSLDRLTTRFNLDKSQQMSEFDRMSG